MIKWCAFKWPIVRVYHAVLFVDLFVALSEVFAFFVGVAKWALYGNEGDSEAPAV